MSLPSEPTVVAPDGSAVRALVSLNGLASLAHFELEAGAISTAIRHRTVSELWYFLSGHGQMWLRASGDEGDVFAVAPGISLTIPVGTEFQFRSFGHEP